MSNRFRLKKESILRKLAQPDDEYKDASPKGSVDIGIRSLVDEINAAPGCITTSSCAGRVAIYFDGEGEGLALVPGPSASGGKGSGKWLYTSHSPILLEPNLAPGKVYETCGLPVDAPVSFPSNGPPPRFVHFKFEPMILHILCASQPVAQAVLTAASQSGFRESGISSLLDAKNRQGNPMVAVRSSGLSFDSIIAFQDEKGRITPMVGEQYLQALITLANERLEKNEIRRHRFKEAFRTRAANIGVRESDGQDAQIRQRTRGIKKKDLVAQRNGLVASALENSN